MSIYQNCDGSRASAATVAHRQAQLDSFPSRRGAPATVTANGRTVRPYTGADLALLDVQVDQLIAENRAIEARRRGAPIRGSRAAQSGAVPPTRAQRSAQLVHQVKSVRADLVKQAEFRERQKLNNLRMRKYLR